MIRAAFLAALLAAAPAAAAVAPVFRDDPRFELFAAVQSLAGADGRFPGFFRHDLPYVRRLEAHFAPYRRHPVVERYERMALGGADYLLFYQFLFRLSDPPELAAREIFPEPLVASLGGAAQVEEFRLLLADFARVSKFAEFYRATAAQRAGLAAGLAGQATRLDAAGALEAYLGLKTPGRLTIILSAFREPSFSAVHESAAALETLYGPELHEGKVAFTLETRLGSAWTLLAARALAGPFARHREALERSASLYKPLGPACAASWPECAQRQIEFAVAGRLLTRRGDAASAEEWPVKYGRIGLPHIAALMARLEEYEAARGRYPDLSAFYPRLIAVFDELAARAPAPGAFLGGLGALDDDSRPLVIASGAYAAAARRRWPGAEVAPRREGRNLSGRALVLAGDWDELGPVLAELQLPVARTASGIALTRRGGDSRSYAYGRDASLASVARHPGDPARGAFVFAGPGAAALIERTLPAGDFVLYEGTVAARVGLYERTRLPWRVK